MNDRASIVSRAVTYTKTLSLVDDKERVRLLKELESPHLEAILAQVQRRVDAKTAKDKAIDLLDYFFERRCDLELGKRLLAQVQKYDQGLLPAEALEQYVIKAEFEYSSGK